MTVKLIHHFCNSKVSELLITRNNKVSKSLITHNNKVSKLSITRNNKVSKLLINIIDILDLCLSKISNASPDLF